MWPHFLMFYPELCLRNIGIILIMSYYFCHQFYKSESFLFWNIGLMIQDIRTSEVVSTCVVKLWTISNSFEIQDLYNCQRCSCLSCQKEMNNNKPRLTLLARLLVPVLIKFEYDILENLKL
jgi:hypothetical protein